MRAACNYLSQLVKFVISFPPGWVGFFGGVLFVCFVVVEFLFGFFLYVYT